MPHVGITRDAVPPLDVSNRRRSESRRATARTGQTATRHGNSPKVSRFRRVECFKFKASLCVGRSDPVRSTVLGLSDPEAGVDFWMTFDYIQPFLEGLDFRPQFVDLGLEIGFNAF